MVSVIRRCLIALLATTAVMASSISDDANGISFPSHPTPLSHPTKTLQVFGKYIVVFHEASAKSSVSEIGNLLESVGGKIVHHLDIIHGIAIEAPASFVKNLETNFRGAIDYIEQDGPVYAYNKPEAL
ncbi:hypothetical protein BC829DRAFT_445150 [Chytridium lagenaria]|nr:hypothetical protein BC829DRAFT_445150 [Chytridium lagenaria]